jgi:hypothetical protein
VDRTHSEYDNRGVVMMFRIWWRWYGLYMQISVEDFRKVLFFGGVVEG